jgi:hypothetical protein
MRYDSRRDERLLRECDRTTASLCDQCNSKVRPRAAMPAITPNGPVYRRHPHSLPSTMTFGLEPLLIPTPWSLACGERHATRSHGETRVALCDSILQCNRTSGLPQEAFPAHYDVANGVKVREDTPRRC